MTTNNIENLFQDIPLEIPSDHFTDNLMHKIEKGIRKEQAKRRWLTVGQIAAGVIGIILTPILVLYFCSDLSFDFFKINLHFNPIILVIGLSVLFLLILDTLFRKHIHL
ncbi:hypothetical protein FACS189423_08400 [Bacteroidia bacterium]|nr:hypothetical protein FACS189423_08400 [Bacteroidia bacterium]